MNENFNFIIFLCLNGNASASNYNIKKLYCKKNKPNTGRRDVFRTHWNIYGGVFITKIVNGLWP